jgi:hypothetical protein
MHVPDAQVCPPLQACPQAPQLAPSVWMFEQALPHLVCPSGQEHALDVHD